MEQTTLDILIAVALVLAAIGYIAAYSFDAARIYDVQKEYFYVWIAYIGAALIFLAYTLFVLYKSVLMKIQSDKVTK